MRISKVGILAARALVLFTNTAFADHIVTTTIRTTVALKTSTITLSPTGSGSFSHSPSTSASMHPGGAYSRSEFRSSVLNSTNYFRAQFEATPLRWDHELAAFAYRHARTCVFEHSGGPYGENLAEGFDTPGSAVDAWASEEKHYEYPDGGFSESTGHFTQLVWQNTTHVGCGAVNCNNDAEDGAHGWFVVCEYSPPGNVEGEYRYNVQKPGESDDGQLGIGKAGSRLAASSRMLVALVAVSSLAVICL